MRLPLKKDDFILLKRLLNYQRGPIAKRLRTNIQKCNYSHFAFTSFSAKIETFVNILTGDLSASNYMANVVIELGHFYLSKVRKCQLFAQFYVFDTKNEVQNRLNDYDRQIGKNSRRSN